MYSKMIRFSSNELKESIIRQYLEFSAKNATYEPSNSCNSFLVFLNFYIKKKHNLSADCFGNYITVLFAAFQGVQI